jgi:hypothetical protein
VAVGALNSKEEVSWIVLCSSKELFYVDSSNRVVSVEVTSRGESLKLGQPQTLKQLPLRRSATELPGSLAPLHRRRQLLRPKLLQPQLPPQHTPQPTVAEGPRPAQHRATAFTSASTSPSCRRLSCRRETLEVFDGHQQPCQNFGAASAINHLTQFDMDAVARLSR